MKLKCKCGYLWDYKGKKDKATCPKCGRKVKVPEFLCYIHTPIFDTHFYYQDGELIVLKIKDGCAEEVRRKCGIVELRKAMVEVFRWLVAELLAT